MCRREVIGIVRAALFLFAFAVAFCALLSQWGCNATTSRPAAYEAALVACNEWADTLAESIDCENKVRRKFGRPLRDAGEGGQ